MRGNGLPTLLWQRQRAFQQIALRDFIDQPERLRLLGRNRVAAGHHLHRIRHRYDARQALRAAGAGQDAELDLGQAEQRLGRGDPVVAGERELEAAAEREAADRGDERLRHLVLAVVDVGQVGLDARAVELLDVGAAGERLRRADEDHCLDRGILVGFLEVLHDRRAQRVGEAVDRRVVHADDGDAVAYCVLRDFTHAVFMPNLLNKSLSDLVSGLPVVSSFSP